TRHLQRPMTAPAHQVESSGHLRTRCDEDPDLPSIAPAHVSWVNWHTACVRFDIPATLGGTSMMRNLFASVAAVTLAGALLAAQSPTPPSPTPQPSRPPSP